MSRWIWFLSCAILGLVMLVCGLLMPVHLRAVDASVIQQAGRNTPALVERGLALVSERKLGSALLLWQTAQLEALPDREKLGLAVSNLAKARPELLVWGGPENGGIGALQRLPASRDARRQETPGSEPFTELVIRPENREPAIELLRASPHPVVSDLLRCRSLSNTVIFSPSQSASGQALDAALAVCGLLLEGGRLATGLSNAVSARTSEAGRGNSQPLEQVLLDLMSLGQRFNWDQLAMFVGRIEDVETLRSLADQVRQAGGQLPVLFSAVQLSGKPADVTQYLLNHARTGMKDLGTSLRSGAGGVNELLRRNQRLHSSAFPVHLALDYCLRTPWLALMVKWFLYLGGGYLLAAALHFARPRVSALERPLQVRGVHVAREILFAFGFLLVVLLLSEPFLSQNSQKVELPFRLHLPTVGDVVPAGSVRVHSTFMNQISLMTLLLFFVLQGLIYTACLVKLAEIRRQQVPPRMKLKLLENEDHLFDAGLYLGFVGTIVSLILVSLGMIQFSLMAAYSSTSFGIVFVVVFKIFHLRPARRKLLLEAEAAPFERVASAASTLPAPL